MTPAKKTLRRERSAVKSMFEGSKMGERVRQVLAELGMKQTELADKVGVRPQTINFIIKSGHSSTLVVPIARALNVSPHWLVTGEGKKSDVSVDSRFSRLPILSGHQARSHTRFVDEFNAGTARFHEVVTSSMTGQAFAMMVESRAMEPDILPGDLVIVDPSIQPVAADLVVAVVDGADAFVRRYRVKSRAAASLTFELVATNQDHETFSSDEIAIEVLGVVSELRRERKTFRPGV